MQQTARFSLLASLLALTALTLKPLAQCHLGDYLPAFNIGDPRFQAVHMAIIPSGHPTIRGMALVWDYGFGDQTTWAIVNPQTGAAIVPQTVLQHDVGTGNLGCAGHAWTHEGKLVVAGGTKSLSPLIGAKHMYVFDPQLYLPAFPNLMWVPQERKLERNRWYPSVYMIAELNLEAAPRLVVLGGDLTNDMGQQYGPNFTNTYESFRPNALSANQGRFEESSPGVQLYAGPPDGQSNPLHALGVYPRMHLLADGRLFMSSMRVRSAYLRHHAQPAVWTAMDDSNCTSWARAYCASVLFPNVDASYGNTVMIIGGSEIACGGGVCPTAFDSVQICKGSADPGNLGCWPTGSHWSEFDPTNPCGTLCTNIHPLLEPRGNPNVVILPDATLAAFGGDGPNGALATAELFRGGKWWALAAGTVPRNYHATAALVPSGMVLLAGGEHRHPWGFQVFRPPYITCGAAQPVITSINSGNEKLNYDQSFRITYTLAPGASVQKVVLMRPSSVTHSTDFDQRYLELASFQSEPPTPGEIWARTPAAPPGVITSNPNFATAPEGYYMLFLVTDAAVSAAGWVELQWE
jgi:hypothetical protein